MYYATGLPGWMRFGYSPGWGGLPPGATYLTTGQWPTPQMAAAWQPGPAPPGQVGPWYGPPPEQELEFLRGQAEMLSQQMDHILGRIDELEKEQGPEKKENTE